MSDKIRLPDMLQRLIELPSVSSTQPAQDMSNAAVIEALSEWMTALGFSCRMLPVPHHPGKFNLIGTLGRGTGGLVLAGHTDTVPYDDSGWDSDPFTLSERDGRYYGLGTSDMKSFLALALEAAREFDASRFKHPLIILATADEETSMSGARALVADDLAHARYAIIGEPTGLRPIHQHKGMMMERIVLRGQSGHSSNPALGNNALEGMHELINELLRFRADLQSHHIQQAFEIPVPTLNLGHIHGGDNPNRICGECELQIDLRPLPGMQLTTLRSQLREIAESTAARRGLTATVESMFPGIEAMQTSADSPVVQAARALTGHSPATVAFGTEGPFLNRLGIDSLILGPGDIDQAHQPNEFLALDRLQPTIDLLRNFINHFCLQADLT